MTLILLTLIIILSLVLIIPIDVFIEYKREDGNDDLKIWMQVLFGLITYKLHIPYLEIKKVLRRPLLKFKAEIEATGSPKMKFEKEKTLSFDEIDFAELKEQVDFIKGLADKFEAIERGLDTFKDELHRLDELTLRNPILLRIIGTLVLSITGRCKKLVWKTKFGIKDPAITGMMTGFVWAIKGIIYSFLNQKSKSMAQPDFEVKPNFNQVNELEIKFESIFSLWLGNIIITGLKIIFNRYKRRFSNKWQTIQLKH
ncbi:DUF2953 domain-containing protein [Selenihalanaerobacter shriftii]|uniref:DUF2953 domain-containing protein n=1 Tax=Selenihalanaerobacter shriftii TaxID=142842 RepID=A0A1T4M7P4_9FIRM|nr:DUF2953 domain-containing protein [Selenihalanaerobacter shriftii]SJZ63029.1 Protein of unknown function [Selenihalanaerobacter shriftii]